MSSICNDCENKRRTWSEKLTEEGYNGCVILFDGKVSNERLNDGIHAETIATGWVVLGMAVNDQLIVKNVSSCNFQNYTPSMY